ncbi:MAG: DUF3667 domain-containing protein [Pseudomonadota bacterium]|jgi:hypothetical protein|nr:DUF3667 domain-containing protein [Pseudomonadota bacterium]
MNTAIESAAAATRSGAVGAYHPAVTCENCAAALAGPFCSQCGQRHHEHPVHSFWHFLQEATEDMTHADSRLWLTLRALLLRPGSLTREFLDGHRVRYLPPVRLYLVVSLLFFFITGLATSLGSGANVIVVHRGQDFHMAVAPPSAAAAAAHGTPATMDPRPVCAQVSLYGARVSPWLAGRLDHSCLAVAARGGAERFVAALERNYERAMFLLLPLLALAMVPLFLEPRRHYVEHLLLLLHNHAFLFVTFGILELAGLFSTSPVLLGPLDVLVTFAIPVYYYLAMRRVYGQSPAWTLGKMAGLATAYLFIGLTVLAGTVTYSFLSL